MVYSKNLVRFVLFHEKRKKSFVRTGIVSLFGHVINVIIKNDTCVQLYMTIFIQKILHALSQTFGQFELNLGSKVRKLCTNGHKKIRMCCDGMSQRIQAYKNS